MFCIGWVILAVVYSYFPWDEREESCPVLCHEKGSTSFTWWRKGMKSSGRDAGEKGGFHQVCSCSQVDPGKEATEGSL